LIGFIGLIGLRVGQMELLFKSFKLFDHPVSFELSFG